MGKTSINTTILFIAKQQLLARKKQSVLAIIGVLIGVATFVVMTGFMTGVNKFLDDAVFNGNPDLTLLPTQDFGKASSGIAKIPADSLIRIAHVLEANSNFKAAAPQILSPAILISNTAQLPISLNGIVPEAERKMVDLERRMVSGSGFQSLHGDQTIILGVSLAKRLKVEVGDSLQVILPNGRRVRLNVSGVFSFGITTIDNIRAYTNNHTMQTWLNVSGAVNALNIKLKDRNNLTVKTALLQQFKHIEVEDWKTQNKTIVIGNKVRNILTWSVSLALLVVAGFGIYNILNSLVLHKKKDIAILRTIGYSDRNIIQIFLIQSIIIGILGALLGIAIGYSISLWIHHTPIGTSDFIIVDTYPVNFNPLFYLFGFCFGILTTLLATYFPAKKASNIDPHKILMGI